MAASGEEVRVATLATLRLALLTGLVLELLAAVGTALVAVPLGLRLDSGARILPQALAVLILTAEVFLPLRRLSADFHAGSSGRAALARLGQLGFSDGAARAPRARAAAHGGPESYGVVLERVTPDGAGARQARAGPDRPARAPGGTAVPDRRERRGQVEPAAGGRGPGPARPRAGPAWKAQAAQRVLQAGPARRWPGCPSIPTVLAATVLDNVTLGRPGIDERAARAALEAARLGSWLAGLPRRHAHPAQRAGRAAEPR